MSARTARIEVLHDLGPDARAAVGALIAAEHERLGRRPLSDQLWLDLVHDAPSWHAAVLATVGDELVAYAQLSRSNDGWTLELVAPDGIADELAVRTLAEALEVTAAAGGGRVHWWAFDPDDRADAWAAAVGLAPGRTLHQMRVALPLAVDTEVATRPFEVGHDEAAWLDVNNCAFAGHAEQGGWDLETLLLRERETWFDPAGFLLHERDGRLAAFCWTKLHHDADPVLGEIYVIAVHPDFHGLGLGKALTVAGLASIASRGVTTGMLFVDHDNTAAVGLYRSLGFHVHRTDRAYVGEIPPGRDITTPAAPHTADPTAPHTEAP